MYDKPLCNSKHEEFAQATVRLHNYTAAYREVYNISPATQARSIWQEASHLAGNLHVGRRIEWLRGQSLERSQISVVAMLQDLHDIATANPDELVRIVTGNCRCCHGLRFAYRWRDADEFVTACETINTHNLNFAGKPALQKPLPSFDGGDGFNALDAPHPMCPECLGVGESRTWIADTTTLSEKARKLWSGHLDKYGRPVMHDQMQARDQLHKLLGAYKTDSNGGALTPPVPQPGEAGKAGEASVTYLAMVHRKAG